MPEPSEQPPAPRPHSYHFVLLHSEGFSAAVFVDGLLRRAMQRESGLQLRGVKQVMTCERRTSIEVWLFFSDLSRSRSTPSRTSMHTGGIVNKIITVPRCERAWRFALECNAMRVAPSHSFGSSSAFFATVDESASTSMTSTVTKDFMS